MCPDWEVHFSFLDFEIEGFGFFFIELLLLFRLEGGIIVAEREMRASEVIDFVFSVFRHFSLFSFKLGFGHAHIIKNIVSIDNILTIISLGLELRLWVHLHACILQMILESHD